MHISIYSCIFKKFLFPLLLCGGVGYALHMITTSCKRGKTLLNFVIVDVVIEKAVNQKLINWNFMKLLN